MAIDFPNSPTTNQTFTVDNRTWQYDGEKWILLALSTTSNIPISLLDIDGGTDIGAAIVDTDLFVVDDGANGTNRKSAISRIYDYITSKFSSLGVTGQNVKVGVTTSGEIDTASGNLTIDSAGGTVTIDDNLVVTGSMNTLVAPTLADAAVGGNTTAASGTGTVATITTTSAHGLAIGNSVTVAGVTPTGYNGTYTVTAVPSTTQFSYANATTGAQTVAGTVTLKSQYTIALTDANDILEFTISTPVAVRVPGSGTAFAVGTSITIVQQGTGTVVMSPALSSSVNLRSSTGNRTRTQYSVATLVKRSDTEWWLMGDTMP